MATWLVTGANRGLGLEFARQLQRRGEAVVATARDPDAAADLRALDVRVERLDIADPASIEALARKLGDASIDVLLNNAGVGGRGVRFAELDWSDVERVISVNAIGTMRVVQALLPNLARAKTRKVVQVTSRMGSIGDNGMGGYYAYRASKAALNMLTRSFARDMAAEGYTCVVVHPGWVRTDMGGATAPLSPAESVAGLLKVVDHLEPSDSGEFLDWTGARVPW